MGVECSVCGREFASERNRRIHGGKLRDAEHLAYRLAGRALPKPHRQAGLEAFGAMGSVARLHVDAYLAQGDAFCDTLVRALRRRRHA